MDHAYFPLNIKALSEAGRIEGLAAGYGNLDAHGEIFAPGAFAASIKAFGSKGRTPAMLLHHDLNRPAGRWDEIRETNAGIDVKGSLALEAADGREAYALLKAGALSGLSVGFRTIKEGRGDRGVNVITEAELFEISLVAVPSNPITKISAVKGIGDVRDLEALLRERGMSGRKAKAAATAAWRAAEGADDTPEYEQRASALLTDANRTLIEMFRS